MGTWTTMFHHVDHRAAALILTLTIVPRLAVGAVEAPAGAGDRASWIELGKDLNWCGAKALWMLALGYEKSYRFEDVRRFCDPSGRSEGRLSIDTLSAAAGKLGLAARPYRCQVGWLDRTGVPALTLHRVPVKQGATVATDLHYIIFLEMADNGVRVIDPFLPGVVQTIARERFLATWTNVALLVADSPSRLPPPASPERLRALLLLDVVALGFIVAWRTRARRRRRALPPGGIVAAALALVTLGGCARSPAGPPLVFDHQAFDAGTVGGGRGLAFEHAFPFVNRSGRTVAIATTKVSCPSCTAVVVPQSPLPPGVRGVVTMKVDLALVKPLGPYATSALLRFDDRDRTAIRLSSTCFVLGEAEADPPRLDFGDVAAGATELRPLRVTIPLRDSSGTTAPAITASSHRLRVETVRTARADARPLRGHGNLIPALKVDLNVLLSPGEPGREIHDALRVELPGGPRPLVVKVDGRSIHPRFAVVPPVVNFGSFGAGAVTRKVAIRGRGAARVAVTSIVNPRPQEGVRAWLEPNPSDATETSLVVEIRACPEPVVDGTVELAVDDARFGKFFIRYFGYASR